MAGAARNHASKETPIGVRERILDAALATLREHGLRKLTQVRVAKRARVRQSHLTYYFPTREDLLEAVATRAVDQIARHAAEATGKSGDQGAMLARVAAAIADPGQMRMFGGFWMKTFTPVMLLTLPRSSREISSAVSGRSSNGLSMTLMSAELAPAPSDPTRTIAPSTLGS